MAMYGLPPYSALACAALALLLLIAEPKLLGLRRASIVGTLDLDRAQTLTTAFEH
jgi:hypothetical protein